MKRKKTALHPINLNLQRIKDDGIVVLDDVHGMPTGDEPFVSPDYVICIGHKGHIDLMYDDYQDYSEKYTVSVIFPNHSIRKTMKTNDYLATLIVLDVSVLNDPMLQIINQMRYRFEPLPNVKLDRHEYTEIMNVVDLMRETVRLNLPDRRALMSRQVEFLLRLLGTYRNNKLNEESPDKRVSNQFHSNLKKHANQHHDVEFYANLACLTPKYFSNVIKQETGYNAGYWIRKHIIAEAKMLLHVRHDLPIQAVADMLGFEEQNAFSRYFKRETGMSPTEFREQ
jgi:AraC-like DNA-binding protein